MSQAYFRFDAGPAIGGGHAMRALALADALRESGWSCTLACNSEALDIIPALNASGHAIEPVTQTDAVPMAATVDLFVVDHYGLDAVFERSCRPYARRILVVDDLANRNHDADILLDPTPGQPPDRYHSLLPDHTHRLLGPAFAPLRPQFQRARGSRTTPSRSIENVLISLGAIDRTGLAERALDGTCRALPRAGVDIVAGGPAHTTDGDRVHRLSHVDDMAALYRSADICIGAAGVSALERCCVGLPALTVVTADNQRSVAAGLARAGAIRLLGDDSETDPDTIADALGALTESERLKMTLAGQELCDGRGVQRIQLAITGVDVADPVRLRLAEPGDRDLMLEWQRDPRTRRHFRTPTAPNDRDHARWIESILNDPQRWLLVVCRQKTPVGILRLDPTENGAREVSIYLDPNMQGRGYGRMAIGLARRLSSDTPLEAVVLTENEASRRAFEAAGFKICQENLLMAEPYGTDSMPKNQEPRG